MESGHSDKVALFRKGRITWLSELPVCVTEDGKKGTEKIMPIASHESRLKVIAALVLIGVPPHPPHEPEMASPLPQSPCYTFATYRHRWSS